MANKKKIDVKVVKRAGKTVLPKRGKLDGTTGKGQPVELKTAGVLGKIVAKATEVKEAKQELRKRDAAGGEPHGVVEALAGTGKTFTLVMAVAWVFRNVRVSGGTIWEHCRQKLSNGNRLYQIVPSPQQKRVWEFIAREKFQSVTYMAFNRTIVRDFEAKYKWLTDLLLEAGVEFKFSTVHSLGNSVTGRHYKFGWKAVNDFNVRNLLELHWQTKPEYAGKTLDDLWKDKCDVIRAVEKLVGLCKLTLTYEEYDHGRWGDEGGPAGTGALTVSNEQLEELAARYDVELKGTNAEVFELVNVLLNQCRNPGGNGVKKYDFDDQIWLPLVNNLEVPKVDLLLVDEAQDMNRCQQELALKHGRRIVICGDKNQAIYGFAGADTESIDRMAEALNDGQEWFSDHPLPEGRRGVERMPLTVTRRCGKAIVAAAQEIVPEFEAHESNPAGEVLDMEYEEAYDQYGEHDMVLCRVNAPLVRVAFSMLRAERPATLLGNQLDKQLIDFVKMNTKGSRRKGSCDRTVTEFVLWLDEYEQKQTERLEKRALRDAGAADSLIALKDKMACLRIFCEGASTVEDIIASIKAVFEQRKGGTLLSSIHRAKGMEAQRVFILRPDLLPHPRAKSVSAKEQERHLKYVGITRAIKTLVWVIGKAEDRCE